MNFWCHAAISESAAAILSRAAVSRCLEAKQHTVRRSLQAVFRLHFDRVINP